MKLCRNRLHPRPEVGICLECRAAQRLRDKLKRASKPPPAQWERRAAKRRKEPAGPPEMDDAARTMRLLAIGDALNRNPMPWDRKLLEAERAAIMAQKTHQGHPKHPLYVPKSQQMVPFVGRAK